MMVHSEEYNNFQIWIYKCNNPSSNRFGRYSCLITYYYEMIFYRVFVGNGWFVGPNGISLALHEAHYEIDHVLTYKLKYLTGGA